MPLRARTTTTSEPHAPGIAGSAAALPLARVVPGVLRLPYAALGVFPTPIERVTAIPGLDALWIKRDDLNAPAGSGGNKVRALEFLLGGVRPGDTVVTIGGHGSTHVLATATHAARLGARTVAFRWSHEMNVAAYAVRDRAATVCEIHPGWSVADAWLRARWFAARHGGHWIPLGGSSPLGIIGHVNAALELSAQISAGVLPPPLRVVVPLGSGGTAAGLALGFALAGANITVIGARVAPRPFAHRRRVLALAHRTSALLERLHRAPLPRVNPALVQVSHEHYGGAYGRPLAVAEELAASLGRGGEVVLDSTYSAKAFAAAVSAQRRDGAATLMWLTFDGRGLMTPTGSAPIRR